MSGEGEDQYGYKLFTMSKYVNMLKIMSAKIFLVEGYFTLFNILKFILMFLNKFFLIEMKVI